MQEYNEAIYNPGTIPAYKPLINNVPTPAAASEIPPDAVTHDELDEAVTAIDTDAIQAAVDTIQNGYRYTNIYNVRPVEETLEEIIARMDNDAKNQSASISITEDEILLQVADMERELVGLIDIQAGAVTALVEGGGASGQMSLTLNLPVMIDATKRAQLITASTEAKVNAVYGLVEGTDYYGIKPTASNAAVKALWDDAVAAALIASQIDLRATQIQLNGDNIYVNGSTMFSGEVGAEKIKAALIDVDNLLVKDIAVKDKGVIHSDNYDGVIDAETGEIDPEHYGSAGWAIDHAGKADFINLHATGGDFFNIAAEDILLKYGARYSNCFQSVNIENYKTTIITHFSKYKKRPQTENVYTACGMVRYAKGSNLYQFQINGVELLWNSRNELTGIIFRGFGLLVGTSSKIITTVQLDIQNDILQYGILTTSGTETVQMDTSGSFLAYAYI